MGVRPSIKGGLGRLGVVQASRLLPSPPYTLLLLPLPALLPGHHTAPKTLTQSDHGNPTHPPWQSGAGQSHLQSRHPSPRTASLPLPYPNDHRPPGVPLRSLHGDKRQPPPPPTTGSESLSPRPQHHFGW